MSRRFLGLGEPANRRPWRRQSGVMLFGKGPASTPTAAASVVDEGDCLQQLVKVPPTNPRRRWGRMTSKTEHLGLHLCWLEESHSGQPSPVPRSSGRTGNRTRQHGWADMRLFTAKAPSCAHRYLVTEAMSVTAVSRCLTTSYQIHRPTPRGRRSHRSQLYQMAPFPSYARPWTCSYCPSADLA